MADKTLVAISIENGAVTIAVTQEEPVEATCWPAAEPGFAQGLGIPGCAFEPGFGLPLEPGFGFAPRRGCGAPGAFLDEEDLHILSLLAEEDPFLPFGFAPRRGASPFPPFGFTAF